MSNDGFENKHLAEKDEESFYNRGKNYWSTVEPTVDGMLGGFSSISAIDIQSSSRFLCQFFAPIQCLEKGSRENDLHVAFRENKLCLDCGAGIGRVTKHLLLNFFEKVHLLEQNTAFLETAKTYIGQETFAQRVDKVYACSIHRFEPDSSIKYDLIWCQWVTGHLTDDDFVLFLKKCKSILNKDHGIIVIKDNHTSSNECDADTKDSSVTRPYWLLRDIFKKAGLKVLEERRQYKFPKGLYPVKMFALQ
ncbi:N-terminal Xaa-Pro-Lys N-methyltransferase 1-like protein [Dinothrombium tinctorium]|uniref:Alpha N-terminal protein methyltransferase 1 n=1 Tax=Dinothrombium tinctorium TaxID=1965070 RepID=A0A3S4QAN0_9ACAR|nr:N-terminal Xaa-Pro-Lys N-methyltransferase 1-like protein [Dinothrombium tinctorium]